MRRNPALSGMLAVLALVILGSLIGLTAMYLNAERHRQLAEQREELRIWLARQRGSEFADGSVVDDLLVGELSIDGLTGHRDRCDLSLFDEGVKGAVRDAGELFLVVAEELPSPHPGQENEEH